MKCAALPIVVPLVLLLLSSMPAGAQLVRGAAVLSTPAQNGDLHPTGKGFGMNHAVNRPRLARNTTTGGVQAGIYYHGGPVILGTTHVYYIFYGDWAADTSGQAILTNLASYIGGSPYFNINTTYYNGSAQHVSNAVSYNGNAFDNYSHGRTLSDAAVENVVYNAIKAGKLPKDSKGVYFVLTTTDVTESSGFCIQYCGWHSRASLLGTNIKYAFVGNPASQCPDACEQQTTRSPNGNPGADAMASVVAHELEESVTDPNLNAWYDNNGMENADKCAWTFGTVRTASNSSDYNMTLGSRQYLIQQNWVNAGSGYCSLAY